MAVGDTFVMDEQDGKTVNRIDKKDTWEAVNPVLGVGEIGIEKDGMLKNIKIGDGQTAWNALGYTFKQCPYEVGDIYMTTSSVTPATRWPGTQWEVFAPGRVLIGAGTGQDSRGESKTFEIGDTGGEYQHQLTTGKLLWAIPEPTDDVEPVQLFDASNVCRLFLCDDEPDVWIVTPHWTLSPSYAVVKAPPALAASTSADDEQGLSVKEPVMFMVPRV